MNPWISSGLDFCSLTIQLVDPEGSQIPRVLTTVRENNGRTVQKESVSSVKSHVLRSGNRASYGDNRSRQLQPSIFSSKDEPGGRPLGRAPLLFCFLLFG